MISCTFENGSKTSLRHVVVHALVAHEGKLLLVKRSPDILEGGKWSLPSGFLDRDETATDAVLRELKEETGWDGDVQSLFMIKTDPNRPHEDRQNVAFHFIVTPRSKTGTPDRESTEVTWFPLHSLPPSETWAFDHREVVLQFVRYLDHAFALPLFV